MPVVLYIDGQLISVSRNSSCRILENWSRRGVVNQRVLWLNDRPFYFFRMSSSLCETTDNAARSSAGALIAHSGLYESSPISCTPPNCIVRLLFFTWFHFVRPVFIFPSRPLLSSFPEGVCPLCSTLGASCLCLRSWIPRGSVNVRRSNNQINPPIVVDTCTANHGKTPRRDMASLDPTSDCFHVDVVSFEGTNYSEPPPPELVL